MVTSFADGTKISFEQATVANATGMSVARRGMRGGDVGSLGLPIGVITAETVDTCAGGQIALGRGNDLDRWDA